MKMISQHPEAVLIRATAAARLLGVHRDTMDDLVARGVLEPVKLHPTAQLRFRRADVLRLVQGGRDP